MKKNTKKKIAAAILFGLFAAVGTGCHFNTADNKLTTTQNAQKPTEQTNVSKNTPNITTRPGIVVTDEIKIAAMAEEIAQTMTLEEKVGQLFIVNLEQLDSAHGSCYEFRKATKAIKENIAKYHIGGTILFSRNIEDIEQTKTLIQALQKSAKVPLFISVDEEGGDVARIASNENMRTTKFPSMQEVGQNENEEYAYNMGCTIGREIKELGFNLDFAPVADVKTNKLNTEIGNRSFGSDAKLVSKMVKEVVTGLQEQGVSSTLKHFPGHGNTDKDSHNGSVNVENDLLRLRSIDFLPFKAGVKAGADFMMVSHISISRVTENTIPASLSSLVMKEMIRQELGFEGIIITDALDMKSITNDYEAGEAAVLAVQAGVDMLLMPEDFAQAYEAVLQAVQEGKITEEKLTASVQRILRTKIKRGVILDNTPLVSLEE